MSFDINWEQLRNDSNLNRTVTEKLNGYLTSINLPSYVNNLRIERFSMGDRPPKVTLRQITDPVQDFYDAINEELQMSAEEETEGSDDEGYGGDRVRNRGIDTQTVFPSANDVQFLVEMEYNGNMSITVTAEMVLNYPSKKFMALPIRLTISNIGFHTLCLIAFLSKQLFFSFLCDVTDPILDEDDSILDQNGPLLSSKGPLERISIIRSLSISTEVGEEYQGDGSVLKSVGKLEQFLKEKLKDFLRKEVAWPSWINFDFYEPEDNESDDNQIN
ncbi:hypothetical protein Kpol_1023p25 [Vanderwaltozyma polyspora DSM 70294]|uniref:Mitochondrial distribution and morphology protein 12 n=1 Tax=Vanderwaltozyma polyspora (strain ATCC 22028 / DSM 70294 / BCRC 21397 / CBS 2163 / NBRC 10782 / NRRL Y-8283 / UCD 57-17) TaxID=436907 RepID=MDM12_VANPO|nr:uncharacterized protein Kpol_1023p25 [Vanderwaltozyma polyspora DSM 70294]A7TFP8.1 RecName: Full=Mitochondrial distribution and morphology protein 12; AltName: Full=Mitochondrial inheritance component MDM12 [Vanderwaltozyma polyspora DSM 70294]EDO18856.1 hypothetical protein Kpol_1023p25 [Vanderwaltozyma polyspora DSM 70294]